MHDFLLKCFFCRESPQSEPMELQLDYWLWRPADTPQGSAGKPAKPDSAKSTLKMAFRSLQVARAPPSGELPPSFTPQQIQQQQQQWLQQQHLFLNYCTKEKKQKSEIYLASFFKSVSSIA